MIMKHGALPPIDPLTQIFLQPTSSTSTTHTKSPQIKSTSKLPPGAKIVGNYLLGKNIGQGTFGKVHLAMHLPTNEKVAVKVIDKKSMRPKDVGRVKNEISILSTVRHRNILQLYQIIETEKSVLLITQFLQKGQLFRQIIKEKKFTEEQACLYFQQMVAGLDYLHRNKIAHRDLKPENILIDYDNQIKIIDFGLSTSFTKDKDLKSFCGSPCYAAPEIIEGKVGYNPTQSDLWSLGVILFVMLTGYLPFCDQDINTVYKQIIACNYKIPSHVSAAARDLIQSLLVRVPSKRISLKKIRDHQWFNIVTPPIAYGLNKGQKLKIEFELIDKIRDMGINEDKVREGIEKNQSNKDTASYFILMKKLSKNNEKVQSYVGGNHFNPNYIEADLKFSDDESETFTDPTILQAIQGPQMMQGQSQQPLPSNSSPDSQWKVSQTWQQEKQVDREELNGLIKDVFSFIVSFKPNPINYQQILGEKYNQQSRIKRIIFEKKEAEFYLNRKHKKSRFELNTPFRTQLLTILPFNQKCKRTESQNCETKRSKEYKRELSTTNSEKKEFRVNKNLNQKKKSSVLENMRISVQLKKNAEKLLPYLNPKQLSKLLSKKERTKSMLKDFPRSQKCLK